MDTNIDKIPIHLFAEKAIKDYIKETITERAIPDFKDGLKPVQRKILWAMYKLGLFYNLAPKKSARVVGEVIGKYSPHGDAGTYQAMVNLAQESKKYNLIDGQGNWGSYSGDSAAAPRYTECRLTKLAQIALLDKDYLKVVPMIDNYDGTEKEPIYLPSRLPFILLNGIQGIAAAARTGLPGFELHSLIDLCIYYLKNQKLEKEDFKDIKFSTIYNGKCISTEEEIESLIETGSGTITYSPECLEYKDRIEIIGIQDNFDFQKMIEKLEDLSEVKNVKDEGTGKIKLVIYLNCKITDRKSIDKIYKTLQTKTLYNINILNRKLNKDNEISSNYKETNIISIIKNWCKFRISLEKDYLNYLIEQKEIDIKYQELLLKASKNLKIIFEALKDDNMEGTLKEKLNLSEEEIKIIIELPLKRLSKLDSIKTENLLSTYKKDLSTLKEKLNNTIKEVIKDLLYFRKEF